MRAGTGIARMALALGLCCGWAGTVSAGKASDARQESFALLNEGVSAYNRGLYEEAVEKLRRSAAISLNSFRAHYYLGVSLYQARRYEEAIGALSIALDLDPRHLQALVALGDAQLKLGTLDDARASYFRSLKLVAGYAPALDGLARSYEAQAQDDRALEYYAQAIASDRGFAPAFTHLGDLYLRQGKVRDAVRLMEEAVAIRPDYAPGLNRLAAAYGKLSMTNEAVAAIHRAIELEPTNPAHQETLGQLQLESGAVAAAQASFERALLLEPHLIQARAGLGELSRRRGDYERALEEIDLGIAAAAGDARASRALTELRADVVRERDIAVDISARIRAGEPTTEEERGTLARILVGRGDWDTAADLVEALPPSDVRQERLAFLRFRAGQYRQALALYADLAARTDLAPAHLNEGVAQALLGNDEGAAAAYRAALASDPGQLEARLYLANALLRQGRSREAAESYRRYLDAGGTGQAAERARRILKQIAADLLPPEAAPLLPAVPPPERSVPASGQEGG